MSQTSLYLLLAASLFQGCGLMSPKVISDRTRTPRATNVFPTGTEVATQETRGGLKASLDPNSTSAQLINISSGTLAGVGVAFPPGSLSIPVTVSITPGSAVNGPTALQNLGITGNAVTSSGVPVEISADKSIDLRNPMVLALPIPRGASLVEETVDRKRLAVLYRVKVAEGSDSGAFTGLVPATELGWNDGKVLFSTKFFGWFSVVELEVPATAAIQVRARYADQISAMKFGSKADLPACTAADQDRIAYVSDEGVMYYCSKDKTWIAIVPATPEVEEEEEEEIPAEELPARILKSDGTLLGKVISASGSGSAWMVIIEETAGSYLFPLYLDGTDADPNTGIPTSTIADLMGTIYFTGSSCTGTAYVSTFSGTNWIDKIAKLSTAAGSLSVGNYLISKTVSPSITYLSSFMTSNCYASSGSTDARTIVPVTLTKMPYVGTWSIE